MNDRLEVIAKLALSLYGANGFRRTPLRAGIGIFFNRDPHYLHAIEKIYADYARFDALTNAKGRVFSLIEHPGRQPLNIEAMLEAYRLGGARPTTQRRRGCATLAQR